MLSVCCSGEQRQCHPGGWAPGRLATGQQCEGDSAQEQGLCFLEPPGLLCIVGLHSCTGGCQHPLHCIFCLQSPSISSICVSVSAHHCLSVKSSAVPSKALLIHCSVDSSWSLPESSPTMDQRWSGNSLFFFFFSLDPTVEIFSMRKENKSCDSQLQMSSKLRWRLLETGPSGSFCTTEPSTLYKWGVCLFCES